MIPLPYRLAAVAALIAALFGTGYWMGFRHERTAWAADVAKLEKAEVAAIIARSAENAKLAAQQASDNAAITKAHDEELATLRARLAAAPRLRVGTSICANRPASATEAQSPASSDSADSSAGLVSERADTNLKQLIEQVETDLATGRACQAFIRDNGMEP